MENRRKAGVRSVVGGKCAFAANVYGREGLAFGASLARGGGGDFHGSSM